MKINDYPINLRAQHVAEIMEVSRSTAYEYMKLPDFPSYKMPGKRGSVRVPRDLLYAWMMERAESPNKGA